MPISMLRSRLGKRRLRAGGPLAPCLRWGSGTRAGLLRGLAQQARAALGRGPIPNPTLTSGLSTPR